VALKKKKLKTQMDYFRKLTEYMDNGYKMTDTDCPICEKSIVYSADNKEFFCVNCKLPVKLELPEFEGQAG
jgi:uncharacterized Zn finger protein (UPF0148 family)